MKAIVMAGGQGSRLRPLTVARPKPLLPIVNKPIILHIIDWLKRYHIYELVLTLQHQADWFQGFLGTGANLGVQLHYVVEDLPLGTAGGVAHALANRKIKAGETVLVVSGDALTDFDLQALLDFHASRQADVTVALCRMDNPLEYGVVNTEADGRITQFLEKPGWGEVISDVVNTGIYVLNSSVLSDAPPNEPYDFSRDLFPRLLAEGRRVYGYVASGYWCDIGTPAAYYRANADMLQNRVRHESMGRLLGGDIWVGENVHIAPDARLFGSIYLGHNVQIKGGVVIQGPAVIRDDTVVDTGALISRSILWRGNYVGENVQITGALVSKQCVFKARVLVQEGAVIGDGCVVGEGAVIYNDVKLWPNKEVESGAQVRNSIIWGSVGRRVLFSRFGVTGVVNVDLTPEFAAKIGVAFGASLPKGGYVTINRDAHPSSRMIKRAIISGLPAAGINVMDLRMQALPVARFFTRNSEAVAGVHVRLSPHDRRVVDVRFMDSSGLNLGRPQERQIEQLFFREDFRRAQVDDIGQIDYSANVEKLYSDAFLTAIDGDAIRDAAFDLAIDYAHSVTSDVLEPMLAQLNVEAIGLNTRVDSRHLSVLESDWEKGMDLLAKLVQAMGLKLGARLDVSGEKVFLVAEGGQRIDDVRAAAAVAELVWRANPNAVVAVPVDRPSIFSQLAARRNGRVVRTKVDLHALMNVASEQEVALAVDGEGNYIFPALQPVPDGMFALATLLQHLAAQQTTLMEVVAELPHFAWLHRHIPCPWEAKGRVMRKVNEAAEQYAAVTVDGVKLLLDVGHWVLIRPDPDRALLHLCVEAPTNEEATALIAEREAWLHALVQET